ncbi:MAG: sodium:alanine symporter family protein [Lachnospiraceae bacterium]|nr:sodium:alanine symporter family protein [Lachnospiraceae bacterium]
MLQWINKILEAIDNFVWGVPLIVLILFVGIFLTIRLRGLQIRKLGTALKFMVKNEEGGKGEVSSFGALCTALSATIGTGNIVGVATALVAGGPGALFWMEIAAFFGMATKYAEGLLAIKYRTIDSDGHVLGGPFYYIENGMGKQWIWLAKIFAFFGVGVGLFGIGTFTQVNGITSAANNFFDPNNAHMVNILGRPYSISVVIAGFVVACFAALVIIGGLKRIARVSEIIVPFMAVIYIAVCLIILVLNVTKIPSAIVEIVQSAFGLRAAAGGALGAIIVAMQKGIARGIFSNEAGLGSAPIAAAAAKTHEPVRQGLVSMTGTFIDTIVVCTMTGLAIVITGTWNIGLEGVAVTTKAFQMGLPFPEQVSAFILMMCLIFFAFTTILGWDYYSERCLEYLTNRNQKAVKVYRWIYILAIFIGPFMTVSAVWVIADIFNALMAIPNLIALLTLSGVIVAETKSYLKKTSA